MAVQNYDYVIVPALDTDSLTLTGTIEPKRRPGQPALKFMTVKENLHPFPRAILAPIPEA